MKKPRGHLLKVDDMKYIMGLPFITFFLTALARGMIDPDLRWSSYLLAALFFACSVCLVVLGVSYGNKNTFGSFPDHAPTNRRSAVTWKVSGFLCISTLAAGWLVGILADSAYMDEYWRLINGATVKDVMPGAVPTDAMKSATVLWFQPGTMIDTEQTIGYMEKGEVYCVAPVTGQTSTPSPVYYAAGENCCDSRSNYDCSKANPDPEQSQKAIVLDTKEDDDPYLTAIKMSASVYNMNPAKDRIPLVFTDDTDGYINDYWHKAFIMIVCLSIFQGFVCIVTGFVVRNLVRKRSSEF
jgi:hypothetical protein